MYRFLSLLLFIGLGFSTTIYIPFDYATIQGGIDNSESGDTVIVYQGTYYENIDYNQKNIVVGSRFIINQDSSFISSTIIDGNGNGSAVRFNGNYFPSTELNGFTIQGGAATYGGGINCKGTPDFSASPTLINLKIKNNSSSFGGGIYVNSNAHPAIISTVIDSNTAIRNGGGIFCSSESSLNIIDVIISNNSTLLNSFNNNNSQSIGGGGIKITDMSTLNLENVIIKNNTVDLSNVNSSNNGQSGGGGIYSEYSYLNFDNVQIENNVIDSIDACSMFGGGGGLFVNGGSSTSNNIVISNNHIYTSYCSGIGNYGGGGIYIRTYQEDISFNDIEIKNNVVHFNGRGGGALLAEGNSLISLENFSITGNVVVGENGRGGGISGGSYVSLRKGIISNNESYYGGGIFDLDGTVENVTIANNEAYFGGGISSVYSTLINCILWQNIPQSVHNYSSNIVYSNIEGGYQGIGNINLDPLFIDSANDDYNLQPNSPCIDAGVDFFTLLDDTLINISSDDYYGSAPDMGGFEFGNTVHLDESSFNVPKNVSIFQNYPNPFNPITTVRYELPEDSFVDVTVYDMLGNVVKNLIDANQSSGYKSIQWDATNNKGEPVSAGVYLYKIQAGDFIDTKKMILLK